ncbi:MULTISPECIES: zonular occludens toxin domain-containing protein [Burkholderia cepacia complex]|uniref:zonular occludens toxin domain-containing protein n=1 Tax=Burkholderia cepacia complex TaxID=87882 RepID=UPI00075E1742|nr:MULTISPECIES: zonular occludens toxin domain-containing protein [Burkholderia cepacia complex]KVH49032.1 Zonular occludens toxin [Burkholderia diffusa]MDI9683247.1 zonular occludens toxin domain-containing protein [Burkholderia cenocepacia]
MAINAYCGVMGSGKSYEVVQGPLLDAIASGRRVVTNVDGINEERIHEFLVNKARGDGSHFGAVVHVRTDDISKPAFFPVEHESAEGATVTPGFVQPGDLLVVDEAWKLWASDKKISEEHMAFFRMHRHFTHPATGVACDVVLMVQDIGDLHRKVKPVVELSFRMHKLKSLGLSSGYRVEQYEGWKQNSKTRVGTYVRKYSKEIFPLYKSYAGVGGKEAVVDKRQNVLRNKRLWLIVGVMLVMPIVSVRFLWSFFHRAAHGTTAAAPVSASITSAAVSHASSGVSGGGSKPSFSDHWRIVGGYAAPGRSWVVLADGAGRLRMESPSMFQNTGVVRVGTVDGEQVSTFSGAKPTAGAGEAVPSSLSGVTK